MILYFVLQYRPSLINWFPVFSLLVLNLQLLITNPEAVQSCNCILCSSGIIVRNKTKPFAIIF